MVFTQARPRKRPLPQQPNYVAIAFATALTLLAAFNRFYYYAPAWDCQHGPHEPGRPIRPPRIGTATTPPTNRDRLPHGSAAPTT